MILMFNMVTQVILEDSVVEYAEYRMKQNLLNIKFKCVDELDFLKKLKNSDKKLNMHMCFAFIFIF